MTDKKLTVAERKEKLAATKTPDQLVIDKICAETGLGRAAVIASHKAKPEPTKQPTKAPDKPTPIETSKP